MDQTEILPMTEAEKMQPVIEKLSEDVSKAQAAVDRAVEKRTEAEGLLVLATKAQEALDG